MLLGLLCANAFAQWQPLASHTTESLRGVGVVNQSIVWASGTHGTYLFSRDGGSSWTVRQVPGAEGLDFRSVVSFGFDAYLLAAGPGEQSRIYYTRHLGEDWRLQFTNREAKGFFDCMAFFDAWHGIVVGDPVDGKFQVLRTEDAGATWQYADARRMPPAIDGEGAFAASNSCITTFGKKNVWFVTGGSVARVFRSADGGRSWKVSDTPIAHGEPSQGIFSAAFRDARHGVIVGGDYRHPERGGANIAATGDGGKTWKLVAIQPQKFFSAVAYAGENALVAAGSAGSAFSRDGLHSWELFSAEGFNAVGLAPGLGKVFAVGANGRIAEASLSTCKAPCPGGSGPIRRK